MPKFSEIPQFTRDGNYKVNIPWDYINNWLSNQIKECNLNMDPDFQRAHVWTEQQQIKFVEFKLKGGKSGGEILFNHPGWMRDFKGEMVLVDGKQRLEAIRKFLNNEIKAFNHYYSEYTDHLGICSVDFIFVINDLKTRKEVLQWYLDINIGGTPHTDSEIEKVKSLLTTL